MTDFIWGRKKILAHEKEEAQRFGRLPVGERVAEFKRQREVVKAARSEFSLKKKLAAEKVALKKEQWREANPVSAKVEDKLKSFKDSGHEKGYAGNVGLGQRVIGNVNRGGSEPSWMSRSSEDVYSPTREELFERRGGELFERRRK